MAAARPPVLILTGPPGAGKTTTAEILAAEVEPAVHLEADRFFAFIRSGFVEPWRPESRQQNEVVMGIVGEAAAAYARAGYFTIVDGIVIPRWFLGPLREVLHAAGLPVAYAVLRPPPSVCKARVGVREGEGLSDPEVVARLWTQFADLGEFEPHAIELEREAPQAAAEAVAARLADGSLAL